MSPEHQLIVEAFKRGYTVSLLKGTLITPRGKELVGCTNAHGYVRVTLYWDKLRPKGKQVYMHQLVAYAKFGLNAFKNGVDVRHKDDIPSNNKGTNILIGSRSDNMLDMPAAKRSARCKGKPSPHRSLNVEQILEIKNAYNEFGELMVRGECTRLAKKFGVSPTTITEVGKGYNYGN